VTGRVLVTGAGGNVGRPVLEELTARGAIVRAADRTPVEGAEFTRLDFTDERTFAAAVDGCSAMFLLRPPAIARVGPTLGRLIDVAGAAGVEHVTFLSVAGAETNRVVPHHRVEKHLAASGIPSTMLRPGFFADNLTSAYREDIAEGRLYVPAGAGRVAFIDARDIGEVAAIALTDPAVHAGHAYHLTGPEAVTFDEVARLLAERLGRPIRYEPATVPGYLRHLRRRGLPLAQVAVQTVLHVGLRRGDAAEVDPTIERLLGRPPRAIVQFVADRFAPGLWGRARRGRRTRRRRSTLQVCRARRASRVQPRARAERADRRLKD
jgi:uncharacterized protein YbjT (DUF2867 family)